MKTTTKSLEEWAQQLETITIAHSVGLPAMLGIIGYTLTNYYDREPSMPTTLINVAHTAWAKNRLTPRDGSEGSVNVALINFDYEIHLKYEAKPALSAWADRMPPLIDQHGTALVCERLATSLLLLFSRWGGVRELNYVKESINLLGYWNG